MLYHSLAFSNLIFFSVILPKSLRISAFVPSSNPNSFAIFFYQFGFLMFSWLPYFTPDFFQFLLHPVVGMCSCHLSHVFGRIFFRCLRLFFFVCITLPFVDIFLIFLLSQVLSGLFPLVVLFFGLLFSFCPNIFQHFSFVLSFCLFSYFYICVSSQISHLGFDFYVRVV